MLPNSLENDYLNGRCVLFVGAGVSARIKRTDGTSVPNWNEFVNQLVEFAYKRGYFDDINLQNDVSSHSNNKF